MYQAFEKLKVQIYGESHSSEIGVIVDNLPRGVHIDKEYVQDFVNRRKSGKGPWSTSRCEEDRVIFDSGLYASELTGETFKAHIENNDVNVCDYDKINGILRPSHSDYAQYLKDGKISSGGGRFSGRMTAPLCIAGAVAKQILQTYGIKVLGYVSEIGNIKGKSYKNNKITPIEIERVQNNDIPTLLESDKSKMINEIIAVKENGDSIGGIVECIVFNMKKGVGDALFEGLEGKISYAVFGVPGVKGVEFGKGFDLSKSRGSEANDGYYILDNEVRTKTNNSGGIDGGVSNGQDILLRVAIKPTPSISLPQNTINVLTKENIKIQIRGRHDITIVPRIVAPIESAVALAILDCILLNK